MDLKPLTIHCILEDKEKNMIIADHYTGISIFKGDHFATYSDEKILPDKGVFAVEEDDRADTGLEQMPGFLFMIPELRVMIRFRFYNEAKNAIGNKIRFIKSDKKGNIWIGTDGNGLFSMI